MCDVTSQERTEELLLDLINLLHSCVVIITLSTQIIFVKEFKRSLIERERKGEIGHVCGMKALSGSEIFIVVV